MTDKIELKDKQAIGLWNRDGEVFVARDDFNNYYMIIQSDTLHTPEEFVGWGSTSHIVIKHMVYEGLRGMIV